MSEKKKKKISASRLSALIENIKVEHDIPVLERIRYPIIWERTTNGYRVQDLQPSKIDNAIDIIKDYYIPEEVLCQGIRLAEDNLAVEEYLSQAATWLRDTQSLAVVEEGTGSIVGVLIGRVLDRTVRTQTRMTIMNTIANQVDLGPVIECHEPACVETESRPQTASSKKTKTPKSKETTDSKSTDVRSLKSIVRPARLTAISEEKEVFGVLGKMLTPIFDDELTIVQNEKLQAIHRLKAYLISKVDILSLYSVDMYYSIYILLVVPDHRGKGLGKALIRSSIEMANKVGCDVVAGIFSSAISQNIVYKEGFKVHEEIKLSKWLEDDEEVFKGIDGQEYSVAVMAHLKVIPEPPPPPVPLNPPRRSSRGARTR